MSSLWFKGFLFVFFVVFSVPVCGAKIERSIKVDLLEELVSGKQFVSRVDVINGVVKQSWSIDGQSVTSEAFDQAILEAEMEERRQERKKAEERRLREYEFSGKAGLNIASKLLRMAVESVVGELNRIKRCGLDAYLVFGPNSFNSQEEFDRLCDETLPKARAILEPGYDFENGYEEILNMERAIEPMAERLQRLSHDSFENAINNCSDTRRLKELLAMV